MTSTITTLRIRPRIELALVGLGAGFTIGLLTLPAPSPVRGAQSAPAAISLEAPSSATPDFSCGLSGDLVGDANPATVASVLCPPK